MLKVCEILDEKNKILRQVSEEVSFPLSKEDKNINSWKKRRYCDF